MKTKKESHFEHAKKIIQSWPKWKREIRCLPVLRKESK